MLTFVVGVKFNMEAPGQLDFVTSNAFIANVVDGQQAPGS
jgi:hypothetical protein